MEETKKRKNFPPLRIEYMFRQITLAVGFDSILEDAGGSKGKGSRRSPLSRSSHGIPLNTRGKGTSFSLNPRATYIQPAVLVCMASPTAFKQEENGGRYAGRRE